MARCEWIVCGVLLLAAPANAGELPAAVADAVRTSDFATAIDLLEPMADEGRAEACYELGRIHAAGLGVERDLKRATELFECAAAHDHPQAMFLLGTHFEKGKGVTANAATAARWYQRASDAGYPRAERKLAALQPALARIPLHRAVERGELMALESHAGQLDDFDQFRRTALGLAADSGRLPVLRKLLDLGASINQIDGMGNTALHYAVSSQFTEGVELLLARGADVTVEDASGDTPLHTAASKRYADLVRVLLAAGAPRDVKNNAGWSPAMIAERSYDTSLRSMFGIRSAPESRSRDLATASTLLGRDGWSRLAVAAAEGTVDVVRAELRRPGVAALDQPDATGKTALLRAVERGDPEIVAVLLAAGSSPDLPAESPPVHLAVRSGQADILWQLIDAGAPVDQRNAQGMTPLIAALSRGKTALATGLVDRGASLTAVDTKEANPVVIASRRGETALVDRMLSRGADSSFADADGRTALWWATDGGHVDTAIRLLRAGADNRPDNAGVSPLHNAARLGELALLAGFGDLSAIIDSQTQAGNSPLMLASCSGRTDMAAALLDAGADVNAKNRVGDSALICAVREKQLPVAQLLVDRGADLRRKNERFENARGLALAHSEPEWRALAKDDGLLWSLIGD